MDGQDEKKTSATADVLSFNEFLDNSKEEKRLTEQMKREALVVMEDFAAIKSQRRREIIMTTLKMFRMLEENEVKDGLSLELLEEHKRFTRTELDKGIDFIGQSSGTE